MINRIRDTAIRENPHCCSGIYNAEAWNKQMYWNKFIRDSDLFGLWALANRNQHLRSFFPSLGVVFCFSACLLLCQADWKRVLALHSSLSSVLGNPCRNGSSEKGYLSFLTGNHAEYFGKRFCLINYNKQGVQRERESLSATLVWATHYKSGICWAVCSIFSLLS